LHFKPRITLITLFIYQFSANAHTLSTPSLTPIGVALSPVAALINHSCIPNCVVVFPKASQAKKVPDQLTIVAIGDIHPGEQVRVNFLLPL
jgi:SET domain-containing protein